MIISMFVIIRLIAIECPSAPIFNFLLLFFFFVTHILKDII
jgi:hypothetical protein